MLAWFIGSSVVVTCLSRRSKRSKSVNAPTDPALVELHRLQRRFQVFQFKVEVLRHEQHAHRQMVKDLRVLRRQEDRL